MKLLESSRLVLRNWKESDYSDLYEYAKDERVGPNAGWPPHKSEEESKSVIRMFIAQDDVYAIVLKEEGKVIGSLGLHARFPDESLKHLSQLEVGYVIHPAYWGFGYAPEAVNRVIQYCFEERDLDLLWCGHFDFNEKSRRVIEKCNFSYQFTRENTLPLLEGKKVMNKYYHITKDRYFNVLQHI